MRAPEQVGRERRQMAGCMNSRRIPERPLLLPLRPGVTPNRPAARGRVPALRPRSWTAGKRHRSDYDGPVTATAGAARHVGHQPRTSERGC